MRSDAKKCSTKGPALQDDLRKLLDYVYYDERKHYIGCPSQDHVYLIIRRLAKHIGYNPNELFSKYSIKLR